MAVAEEEEEPLEARGEGVFAFEEEVGEGVAAAAAALDLVAGGGREGLDGEAEGRGEGVLARGPSSFSSFTTMSSSWLVFIGDTRGFALRPAGVRASVCLARVLELFASLAEASESLFRLASFCSEGALALGLRNKPDTGEDTSIGITYDFQLAFNLPLDRRVLKNSSHSMPVRPSRCSENRPHRPAGGRSRNCRRNSRSSASLHSPVLAATPGGKYS